MDSIKQKQFMGNTVINNTLINQLLFGKSKIFIHDAKAEINFSTKEIIKILLPYDNWFSSNQNPKNDEAKKALHIFYYNFRKCKVDKAYITSKRTNSHFSYIPNIIAIRKSLEEQNYFRACNEIISLNHYEPIFQGRIYFNLLNILEKTLEV